MYKKEIIEYMRLRLEQGVLPKQIAREVLEKFKLKKSVDAVRMKVRQLREDDAAMKNVGPIKRLFFDIETGYYILKIKAFSLRNHLKYFNPNDIEQEKKIICISYKWQYDDKVHTLTWDENRDDKKMVREFIKIMEDADEIVGHNGDNFDIKELRTRAILNRELMFPMYRTLDTLKKSRKYFRFASNKLDYIGKILTGGRKLDHEGFKLWEQVVEGNKTTSKRALKKMSLYCEQDVILLEDVFMALSPFIDHNTNFAVLKGGSKWECPECASDRVQMHHTDTTAMGWIRRFMKCNKCKKQYKISNKTYMKMLEAVAHER